MDQFRVWCEQAQADSAAEAEEAPVDWKLRYKAVMGWVLSVKRNKLWVCLLRATSGGRPKKFILVIEPNNLRLVRDRFCFCRAQHIAFCET